MAAIGPPHTFSKDPLLALCAYQMKSPWAYRSL